ncbi:hypothetical protein EV663_1292 [Rhodovulum bhavnagarense]|uniref:Uncharacterized protein n=1 Tax=Rhodovulum bhavnagarense TaxID=992286 RepID=A0A4R2RFF7_9RHOB|nr:hypothetical protein EV663_1292 [Rhodovulum bhavnagarense]
MALERLIDLIAEQAARELAAILAGFWSQRLHGTVAA